MTAPVAGGGVGVLAAMDRGIADLMDGHPTMWTARDVRAMRAAVAELIAAAKKAEAVMATPDRIEPRHRQELCDAIARCEMPRDPRIAALAQVSP